LVRGDIRFLPLPAASVSLVAAPYGILQSLLDDKALKAALAEAFQRAKAATKTSVIVMQVDPHEGWTNQGHAWWEIGTPAVSDRSQVEEAHAAVERGRSRQRAGV
jgi:TPP-dependent trihydroxycyclohexane-1,2-dione (THcHDO) dehydratase